MHYVYVNEWGENECGLTWKEMKRLVLEQLRRRVNEDMTRGKKGGEPTAKKVLREEGIYLNPYRSFHLARKPPPTLCKSWLMTVSKVLFNRNLKILLAQNRHPSPKLHHHVVHSAPRFSTSVTRLLFDWQSYRKKSFLQILRFWNKTDLPKKKLPFNKMHTLTHTFDVVRKNRNKILTK